MKSCFVELWYGMAVAANLRGMARQPEWGAERGSERMEATRLFSLDHSLLFVCLGKDGDRGWIIEMRASSFFFAWDYILPSTSRTRCGMQSTQSASSTRHGYYKRGSSHREWHYIYCCTLQKVSPYRRQPIDMTKTCLILDANIYI